MLAHLYYSIPVRYIVVIRGVYQWGGSSNRGCVPIISSFAAQCYNGRVWKLVVSTEWIVHRVCLPFALFSVWLCFVPRGCLGGVWKLFCSVATFLWVWPRSDCDFPYSVDSVQCMDM